jgi:hypothetical protein
VTSFGPEVAKFNGPSGQNTFAPLEDTGPLCFSNPTSALTLFGFEVFDVLQQGSLFVVLVGNIRQEKTPFAVSEK